MQFRQKLDLKIREVTSSGSKCSRVFGAGEGCCCGAVGANHWFDNGAEAILKELFSTVLLDAWRSAGSNALVLACSLLTRLPGSRGKICGAPAKDLTGRRMLDLYTDGSLGEGYKKMPNEAESKEVEKKSKSKSLLIIVLALVVLLGAAGAGVYLKIINLPWVGAAEPTETKPVFYPMQTFLVNLADPGSKRFLKVTMDLELSSKAAAEECKSLDFQLRDLVLTVLSSQQSEDVVTPQQKLTLKKILIKAVNHILTKGQVLDIYFTNFLIQ